MRVNASPGEIRAVILFAVLVFVLKFSRTQCPDLMKLAPKLFLTLLSVLLVLTAIFFSIPVLLKGYSSYFLWKYKILLVF